MSGSLSVKGLDAALNAIGQAGLGYIDGQLKKLDPKDPTQIIDLVNHLQFLLGGAEGISKVISPRTAQYLQKYRGQLSWVADSMRQPGNNLLPIAQRFLQLAPKPRQMLLRTLVWGSIMGSRKRARFEEKYGFPAPFFVVISPSMFCSLGCRNCYAFKYDRRQNMSYQTLSDFCIHLKREFGVVFIVLTGGSPTEWKCPDTQKGIFDLAAEHQDMYFQFYTHGRLLANEQAVAKLLELGNLYPCTSIEGLEAETVERRGPKTWQALLQFWALAREARIPFGFSVTVTRWNFATITSQRFLDFIEEQGFFPVGWDFICIPIGSGQVEDMVTPEQRDRLRQFVTVEVRRTRPFLWFCFWNDGCLVDGCIAGGRHVHILPDGRVTPCVFSPFAVPGMNIKTHTLAEILQSSFLERVRHYQRQRNDANPLLPCQVIDEPYHLAWAVQETGAEPAYPGAEQLIDPKMTALLEQKAAPYRELARRVWESGQYDWTSARQKQLASSH